MNAETLFEALQAIPDHRTKKGRRFELATILVIALAAMLSGANDLLAIARWGRRLSPQALWALGASKKRRKAPCHSTYHYFFWKFRRLICATVRIRLRTASSKKVPQRASFQQRQVRRFASSQEGRCTCSTR